jgi:tetratricopeptide (TPR) repeat protein
VAQSVRQRVAALPEGARELLGIAAVAGRVTARALLTQISLHPEREVLAALEDAGHAGLLEEEGATAYRFAHDVIREVVEADLGAARRMVLHRDIARVLERAAGEPLDIASRVEELAYHYARTEEHASAALWLERAGDQAAAGFANAAALAHYGAARDRLAAGAEGATALSRLDEKLGDLHLLVGEYAQAQERFAQARAGATMEGQRAELWRKEGDTWARRGEHGRALAAFAAGEAEGGAEGAAPPADVRAALALSRGDTYLRQHEYDAAEGAARQAVALLVTESATLIADRLLARAHLVQGEVALRRGQEAQMEEHLEHSLALAKQSGDQVRLAEIRDWQGILAWLRGDLAQAEEHWQECLALAERSGDQAGMVLGWGGLCAAFLSSGDLARAEECAQQGLALAERSDDQAGIASAYLNIGDGRWYRGMLEEAQTWLQRGTALMERIGNQFGSAWGWIVLGEVACDLGQCATAVTHCRHARRLARGIGEPRWQALAAVAQARAHLMGGRPRRAAVLLHHARASTTEHGFLWAILNASLVEAELHLCQGALDQARKTAEEALRLATDRSLPREEALARRLLGQCALAGGRVSEAEGELGRSLALLTEKGMVLEAARTRLALAEVLVRASSGGIPAEARLLLAEARAQFAASGAARDLAEAERLEALCGHRAETAAEGQGR